MVMKLRLMNFVVLYIHHDILQRFNVHSMPVSNEESAR